MSTVTAETLQGDSHAPNFGRHVHGRTLNTISDQYYLPTDSDEWNRLNKQHAAVTLALDGLYPSKDVVQAVLRPQDGISKTILDLGCGTGVWVVEMAKQFPWAEVVGVDLALCPIPIEKRPNNTRFEIHDINTGLSNFEGQFDMVHLRFVGSGLKDFAQKMKDVHSCLKPGGIVLWVDADFELYSTDQFRKLVPATDAAPEGSWLQRFMVEGRRAYLRFGSDVEGMENAMDAGLWSDPILDPETCKAASLYLPIGPWAIIGQNIDSAQTLLSIGSLMTQNILNGLETAKPAFKRVGWPDATIDIWSTHVYNECAEVKYKPSYRVRLAWGRRRATDGGSAPPLPALTTTTKDLLTEERPLSNMHPHYPYFFVYDSQEVSLEQAAIRNKDKALDLPPLPSLFV